MQVGVTGARGHVGQRVLTDLLANGHDPIAIVRGPWPESPVAQRHADITNYDQLFRALVGCEAVIHLAAIPSPHRSTDSDVFQTNLMGVFNTLLAAGEQGIQRAAVASSDCAFGFPYSIKETRPMYLPVDENHPCAPDNSYGLSKVAGEQVADAMAKRFGMSIASLRITWTVDPDGYNGDLFHRSSHDPNAGPWNLWSYIDNRDCAPAFRLAIEHTFSGHELFCITAEDTRCQVPSQQLIRAFFPDVPVCSPIDGHASLQNCDKAWRVLGFRPQYRWRECKLPQEE